MYYYDYSESNKYYVRDVSCLENSDYALVTNTYLCLKTLHLPQRLTLMFLALIFVRIHVMRNSIEILHQNFKFPRVSSNVCRCVNFTHDFCQMCRTVL